MKKNISLGLVISPVKQNTHHLQLIKPIIDFPTLPTLVKSIFHKISKIKNLWYIGIVISDPELSNTSQIDSKHRLTPGHFDIK